MTSTMCFNCRRAIALTQKAAVESTMDEFGVVRRYVVCVPCTIGLYSDPHLADRFNRAVASHEARVKA